MKHQLFILTVLFFLGFQVEAQEKGEFSVEANLFRVAENAGLSHPGFYRNSALFFNGINVGYSISKKFRPYVAFIYNGKEVDEGYGFSAEDVEKKETDFRAGVDFTFNPKNRLRVVSGAELFQRNANITGEYFVDYGPDFSHPIDHEVKDSGWAITTGLSYDISDNFYVFSKARLGLGNYEAKAKSGFDSQYFNPYEFESSYEEPISSMGIAVTF